MGRSVVLQSTPRCGRCRQATGWCLCALREAVPLPWAVDVLMHHGEMLRPTSTGHLIGGLVPGAALHLFRPEGPPDLAEVRRPGHALWVLHPFGDELPALPEEPLQVVLVDGSWKQASTMVRAVGGWGRKVRLPMAGESRYWLRAQQEGGRFSTLEALLFLLDAFGRQDEARRLRVQFELHVYSGLVARGDKRRVADYLGGSAVRAELEALLERRRNLLKPAPVSADASPR